MKHTATVLLSLFVAIVSFGSETAKEGSPEWIVSTFFTQSTFPNAHRYYAGEMLGYLKNPPMGAYVHPGYSSETSKLSQSTERIIYRFTYSNSTKAGDWYTFLKMEDGTWKLSAVRTLAIPRFVHVLREQLRAKSPRTEEEETALQKFDLMLASDADLRKHASDNLSAFKAVVAAVQRGEEKEKLKPTLAALRCDNASLENDGCVKILIGGILDNSVGYLYVPAGKMPPQMSQEEYILIEPIIESWYLFKTT